MNRNKLITTAEVRPGQQFTYYGLQYTRATDDECARHPGRELNRKRGGVLVLAYSGKGDKRQPVTFVPDLRVVVTTPKRRKQR